MKAGILAAYFSYYTGLEVWPEMGLLFPKGGSVYHGQASPLWSRLSKEHRSRSLVTQEA